MSNIAILAPSPIEGSGGVARIYKLCETLSDNGHNCHLYVFDANAEEASSLIDKAMLYYSVKHLTVFSGIQLKGHYDLIIATRWDTAKIVRDMPSLYKAYLVQDYEACFNPVGDGTIFAENSYLYGLQAITYGRWLAHKLSSEYGNDPYFCDFSSDLATFRVTQPIRDRLRTPRKVCFIFQHDKPRRCPQLGIEALGIVKARRPEIQLFFVGSSQAPSLWYDYENLGMMTTSELNDIYNECHVGLCLSSSNPSCNPFDMMAAGLPCVDLYKENNLLDIPDGGVLLAHQTPESIADAIIQLISSDRLLLAMSDYGINFMRGKSSANEHIILLDIVNKILKGERSEFHQNIVTGRQYGRDPVISTEFNNKKSYLKHASCQGSILKKIINF